MATRLLCAALLAAASHSACAATITITDDPGGSLPEYADRYSRMALRSDRLVISGRCASACTLFLVYVPSDRVCATPSAKLQFHRTSGPLGSGWLLSHYPVKLSRWITSQGGLTETVITLQGSGLRELVRPCQ